jgi:hypothetical protein
VKSVNFFYMQVKKISKAFHLFALDFVLRPGPDASSDKTPCIGAKSATLRLII